MNNFIFIKTKRYSKFFTHLLTEYQTNVQILIDGKEYKDSDIKYLKEEWCTNKKIRNTRDFLLKKEGDEIVGFHDYPEQTWIANSENAFINVLIEKQIIRIDNPKTGSEKSNFIKNIIKKILKSNKTIQRIFSAAFGSSKNR